MRDTHIRAGTASKPGLGDVGDGRASGYRLQYVTLIR
jgi:hypothetical protein